MLGKALLPQGELAVGQVVSRVGQGASQLSPVKVYVNLGDGGDQLSNDLPATKPPSIEKVAPVTKSASAEARNRII
jgi:hypothetical protein